jgi:hypothetical protein
LELLLLLLLLGWLLLLGLGLFRSLVQQRHCCNFGEVALFGKLTPTVHLLLRIDPLLPVVPLLLLQPRSSHTTCKHRTEADPCTVVVVGAFFFTVAGV